MTAPENPPPTTSPRTSRAYAAWAVRLLVVAVVGTLVELLLVIPVFPAAASDLRGLVALFIDCVSLYLLFGLPFALLGSLLEGRLRLRLPPAAVLIAAAVVTLLVTWALAFVDRVAAGHPAEFPEVISSLLFIARAAIFLVAVPCIWAATRGVEALLKRMPNLGEARIVWAACSFAAAIVAIAFAHFELAPVYLSALGGVCGLFFLVAGLFGAGLTLRPSRKWTLRVSAALAVLIVVSIPFRFDEHARFVLFGHVPVAGRFAVWLRSAGDSDGDSAGSPWLFGVDCAPNDPKRGPTLIEKPGDGIDQDCRGGDAVKRVVTTSPGAPWEGCTPPENPSVLLITIDAFRADHLRPDVTPFLVQLARTSTVYTRAYAPAGMTAASLASMFTGKPMTDLNSSNVIVDDAIEIGETFVTSFAKAKYLTGGETIYEVPGPLAEPFAEFNAFPLDVVKAGLKRQLFAATLVDHTLDAFRRAGPRPLLWWVHHPDAHAPYQLATDLNPGKSTPYELGLRHIDRHLARLAESLVRMEKATSTILVVTSDHGEQVGDRAREGHGAHLFEEGIHVPLIIHVPGCPPRIIDEPVSNERLGATLARLADVPTSKPTLLPGSTPSDLPIIVEEAPGVDIGFKRAVIDGDIKLIVDVQNGGRMLFDLRADPGETQNLARRRPDLATHMEQRYQRWLDALGAR